jgi:hypothetical protein
VVDGHLPELIPGRSGNLRHQGPPDRRSSERSHQARRWQLLRHVLLLQLRGGPHIESA